MKVCGYTVLYGRGIPSIAEQLGKTVKEAQNIYDSVLAKFEGLAKFLEASEDMAREYGYTVTKWGRRRQLKDMRLPYYEFGYKNGFTPDFDPLSDDSSDVSTEVPIEIVEVLTNKLLNCWGYKKREELKERIRQKGYTIKDNTAYIKRAQRQCVNCVDFDTEILTTSGWKYYDEVSVGDEILSFNVQSCAVEKDTIKDVHVYNGDFDVYEFKNQSFNAVSTPDHRWVSSTHDTKPKFVTTDKIASVKNNPSYPILKMWDNNLQDNSNFTDAQLRIISYLMTDGYFSDSDKPYRAQMMQSENTDKNKRVYLNMINDLNECGIKFSDSLRDHNCHYLYLYKCDFTDFIRNTFKDHILTYDFISALSQRQAKVMVDCFVDCDGSRDKRFNDERVTFSSKEKADVFQYLCVVAGCASNMYSRDCVGVKHFGNVTNSCGYIESKSVYYIVSILNRKRVHLYPKNIEKSKASGVWCVTTGNETWIARHNGCVFITGNSRVQGSSADLTKLAQIELYNNEELRKLGFRMLIPVHDEIIAECPEENVKRCSELMSKCMLDAGKDLCVPLSCDVAVFKSWYGKELDPDAYDDMDEDEDEEENY